MAEFGIGGAAHCTAHRCVCGAKYMGVPTRGAMCECGCGSCDSVVYPTDWRAVAQELDGLIEKAAALCLAAAGHASDSLVAFFETVPTLAAVASKHRSLMWQSVAEIPEALRDATARCLSPNALTVSDAEFIATAQRLSDAAMLERLASIHGGTCCVGEPSGQCPECAADSARLLSLASSLRSRGRPSAGERSEPTHPKTCNACGLAHGAHAFNCPAISASRDEGVTGEPRPTEHARSCPALAHWDADCTCRLDLRQQLWDARADASSNRAQYEAWRKRAEEAERQLARVSSGERTGEGTPSDEIKRLRGIIERERTAACMWIERIRAEVNSRRGISESRGPYEWDDEEYFKEFGAALDAIEKAIERAQRETNARSWDDCPRTQAEVDAASASLIPEDVPATAPSDDVLAMLNEKNDEIIRLGAENMRLKAQLETARGGV